MMAQPSSIIMLHDVILQVASCVGSRLIGNGGCGAPPKMDIRKSGAYFINSGAYYINRGHNTIYVYFYSVIIKER